jgi:hypothetical protein
MIKFVITSLLIKPNFSLVENTPTRPSLLSSSSSFLLVFPLLLPKHRETERVRLEMRERERSSEGEMQTRGREPERETERERETKQEERPVTRRPRWCDFRRDRVGFFWQVKTGLFGGMIFPAIEAFFQQLEDAISSEFSVYFLRKSSR